MFSKLFLASLYRLAENIFVLAIVVPETKFSDVERQIFFAEFVTDAGHAPLEQSSPGQSPT
ncbi:MAG TPA: hypothetical protein VN832_02620 [Stellaceae bacterium]|nr:hypothetical protein [Stellaceae bacterium]